MGTAELFSCRFRVGQDHPWGGVPPAGGRCVSACQKCELCHTSGKRTKRAWDQVRAGHVMPSKPWAVTPAPRNHTCQEMPVTAFVHQGSLPVPRNMWADSSSPKGAQWPVWPLALPLAAAPRLSPLLDLLLLLEPRPPLWHPGPGALFCPVHVVLITVLKTLSCDSCTDGILASVES